MSRITIGLFHVKHGYITILSVFIGFLKIREYDQYRRRNKIFVYNMFMIMMFHDDDDYFNLSVLVLVCVDVIVMSSA